MKDTSYNSNQFFSEIPFQHLDLDRKNNSTPIAGLRFFNFCLRKTEHLIEENDSVVSTSN